MGRPLWREQRTLPRKKNLEFNYKKGNSFNTLKPDHLALIADQVDLNLGKDKGAVTKTVEQMINRENNIANASQITLLML